MKQTLLIIAVAVVMAGTIIFVGSLIGSEPSEASLEAPLKVELPDPKLTPGAVDLAVTPDNVKDTVCVRGYSKNKRPNNSDSLKEKVLKAYGYTDKSKYTLDHPIPISLGGSPDSLSNLWPQPKAEALLKDKLEYVLYANVCNGTLDLRTAQNYLVPNWYYTFVQLGLEGAIFGAEVVDPDDLE